MADVKYIDLVFPFDPEIHDPCIPKRRNSININHVRDVARRSCVAMFFDDPALSATEMVITQYTAYEWDVCLAIAEGLVKLYGQSDRIVDVYQQYFDRGELDEARNQLIKDLSVELTDVEKLMKPKRVLVPATPTTSAKFVLCSPDPGVVCVSERVYAASKAEALKSGLIPFQLITINDHQHALCFDQGMPIKYHGKITPPSSFANLRDARSKMLEKLCVSRETNQPLYGDKYKDLLLLEYTLPKESRGFAGIRGCVGAIGDEGCVGPIGPRGPTGAKGACCAHCINFSKPDDVFKRCWCATYNTNKTPIAGCRDFRLEVMIDLCSLDEVKFIKATAEMIIANKMDSARLLDPIPAMKLQHTADEYAAAEQQILLMDLWPHKKAIHTSLLSNMDDACLQVYVGFVRGRTPTKYSIGTIHDDDA